ncbi:hypothetical protein RYA05_02560 [Pseudomonas syringae pv. actinidiae]|nr:hypothetical protein [Pseudomonas syringae pv. actinidiae]
MIAYQRNPRFNRIPHVNDSELAVNIFIKYVPTGFWADAVTLNIDFLKIHEGEEHLDACNGYRMTYDITASSGGQDSKSGLSKLEAIECFTAAAHDATQIVRNVNVQFLQGQSLVAISQSLFEIDLPDSCLVRPLAQIPNEMPAARLPNDIFVCEGRLWKGKGELVAYLTARNPAAEMVEIEISRHETEYWWFMLKHARSVVLGYEDIAALTQPAQA